MLLQNIRAKIGARLSGQGEEGFTLIELLVVMLILGILAAIAIPAFFNQKEKAHDSSAKEEAHTAQIAMETCGTEHGGKYEGCTKLALVKIEKTLGANGNTLEETKIETGGEGYEVAVKGSTGNVFTIKRISTGAVTFPCTTVGNGGCPSTGFWSGIGE